MVDVVDKATRSRMMAGIRGKDTKPELIIRKALHKAGFRYRLHYKKLPGKPDLVFPKYRALIQINGCFWHGHNCHLFRLPSTRTEFWKKKIEGNIERDCRNLDACHLQGWRTLVIWECALKGKEKLNMDELMNEIGSWILNGKINAVIEGHHQDGYEGLA